VREIWEVMEVRRMIELFSAGKVVEEKVPIGAELAARLDEQRSLAQRGDAAGFIECDRRFHSEIVRAAGNDLLLELYQRLRDRQLQMGVQAVLRDPRRLDQVLEEHGSIVAGFERGDGDEVSRAIETHLSTTLGALRGDGRA
jgi:DNA-binding GntR family transcriptional regulator